MTTLTQLIEQYCSDGVEYVKLGDVAEVGTGKCDRKNATDDGEYPFFVRSEQVLRYPTYQFDEEAIIVPGEGGIGEIFHYINGKYALHQRAYRVHFIDEGVSARYALYAFKTFFKNYVMGRAVTATVTSLRKPMFTEFQFPFPPREVQDAIVERLDAFAALIESLDSEIVLREKRFGYFREQLLGEAQTIGDPVLLGELAEIHNSLRRPITKKNRLPGETPYYGASGIVDYVEGYTHEGDYLLVSEDGANLRIRSTPIAFSVSGQNWVNNHAHVLSFDSRHLQRYVEHYFECLNITEFLGLAAQPKLTLGSLKRIPIAVPPDADVREITEKLDTMQALIDNLKQERELRRTQFEYYREKLLTFNS